MLQKLFQQLKPQRKIETHEDSSNIKKAVVCATRALIRGTAHVMKP